jgi:DNA-binding CsgD family transcriptional regulator
MPFWFFRRKDGMIDKKISELDDKIENSFFNVRNDMENLIKWINHFHNKHRGHDNELENIKFRLEDVEKKLEYIWTTVQTAVQTNKVSKQIKTDVRPKQMSVQKNLQDLRSLTVMERAVVWVLLNTDLKMSYDDLCVVLGKDKSTLRGQINNIKQKNESLIKEYIEKNGKKRFYIDEKLKNEILVKVNQKELKRKK